MFEILLVASCWHVGASDARSVSGKNADLASVVTPSWPHATGPIATAAENDRVSLPEATSIINGDVPPFPAVLNSRGCQNVARAWNSLPGTGLNVLLGAPIDSSNDPQDLSPVTDEVAALIDRWEKASPQAPRQMKFSRTTYNLTREIETRANGVFVYQSPDLGEFRFRGDTSATRPSHRTNSHGTPFVVDAELDQSWSWKEDELLHVDRVAKTYSITPTPLSAKATGLFRQSIHEFAPFIIDIRADVIRLEWSLNLIKQDRDNVFLETIPRTAVRKQQFSKCLLCINTKSAQLTAIKYIDASQTQETVYVLDGSAPMPKSSRDFKNTDCERWGLKGLRQVQLMP